VSSLPPAPSTPTPRVRSGGQALLHPGYAEQTDAEVTKFETNAASCKLTGNLATFSHESDERCLDWSAMVRDADEKSGLSVPANVTYKFEAKKEANSAPKKRIISGTLTATPNDAEKISSLTLSGTMSGGSTAFCQRHLQPHSLCGVRDRVSACLDS
jgi:hypothetical protein